MNKIRWGILGTGSIAHKFADGLSVLDDAELVAVGSRSQEGANKFAGEFGVARAHGSYEALASDPEVDVIYIATPHPYHRSNSLLCLEHGKHVLCEKPVTVNGKELEEVLDAAHRANRFFMEAMWMYFTPNVCKAEELVRAGAIGRLRMVQANFGFATDQEETGRLLNPELAGGSLLDVGIYPIALASLFFQGPPKRIQSDWQRAETGVDAQAAMLFGYEDGGLATLTSAVITETPYDAWIMGEKGMLKLHAPFWGRCPAVTLIRPDQADETFSAPLRGNGYDYEAEHVGECIRAGRLQSPRVAHDKSREIMATMDTIRAQWGLQYPFE
jgi:dihydrodiol dehydrogenase / D-xylose 1-dehydrogenase (NADP)